MFRDMKSRIIFGTLIVCLGLMPLYAHAAIPTTVTFRTEYCTRFGNLSSESPASDGIGAMPRVDQSLTAQYSVGADPQPNRTIKFKATSAAGFPSNLVSLDVTSAITNIDGKCRVIIHGGGQVVNNDTNVYVWATRLKSDGTVETEEYVVITLKRHNTTYAESPANKPPRISPIKFDDSLIDRMSSYSAQARTEFTSAGEIAFTRDTTSPTLKYREVRVENKTLLAQTSSGISPPEIQYNMYTLDEGDIQPPAEWTSLSWRHHVQSTTNHEMGHYLLLGHNTTFEKSLMWGDIDYFFVWKTEKPRSDSEWTPIHNAY